jgi:hypothetical protein
VSTTNATPATGDQAAAVSILVEHAGHAVDDAHQALDAGDGQHAAIRLLEASELYRAAAHQLDPEIHPTGLIVT